MFKPKTRKWGFEVLEDRRVLATLMVNTTDDNSTAVDDVAVNDGTLTLREAIDYASGKFTPGSLDDDQITGGQPGQPGVIDIIDLTAVSGQIDLVHGQMDIKRSVVITGPGRDVLTINADANNDATGDSRIFAINVGFGDSVVQRFTPPRA